VVSTVADVPVPEGVLPGFLPEFPPEVTNAPHRRPAAVLVLGAAGLLQAVALVAVALTGLTGMLAAEHRAPDLVVAAVLGTLATWTVLSASAAAAVLDGTGRGLLTWTGAVELAAGLGALVLAVTTPLLDGTTGAVPAPAAALLLLAVPAGRLLLAGAPSTLAWTAAGPRPREPRSDPVATHRGLCLATLAVIGLALGAVALLGPTGAAQGVPAPAATSTP
jgi:hypothetical protein